MPKTSQGRSVKNVLMVIAGNYYLNQSYLDDLVLYRCMTDRGSAESIEQGSPVGSTMGVTC